MERYTIFMYWKFIIFMIFIMPQFFYGFNKIAIKISADIIEIDKLFLKLIWKCKEYRLASILKKKD